MSEIRQLRSCERYLPSHQVHWIQARLGREDQENRPDTGRVVDIRDDGTSSSTSTGRNDACGITNQIAWPKRRPRAH
jgi:hypothetical protein